MTVSYRPVQSLLPMIGTTHPWCAANGAVNNSGLNLANSVGTNNIAFYVPMTAPIAVPIKRLWVCNGGVLSGNVDLGVYDGAGTLLLSTGSTASAGTSVVQFVDVGDRVLPPGQYYLALDVASSSNRIGRVTPLSSTLSAGAGCRQQTGTFPLPSTATFATYTQSYIPVFGIDTVGAP